MNCPLCKEELFKSLQFSDFMSYYFCRNSISCINYEITIFESNNEVFACGVEFDNYQLITFPDKNYSIMQRNRNPSDYIAIPIALDFSQYKKDELIKKIKTYILFS